MNLPNKLTLMRMAAVPVFVFFLLTPLPHHWLVALLLFGAASYTDHLDGKIARARNLITNFGKLMDPLADKLLVISALVCLAALGLANAWFVIIIIAREFLVTSVRLLAVESGTVIPANAWGKAKTVSQMLAILVILGLQYAVELTELGLLHMEDGALFTQIASVCGEALLAVAVVLTLISGATYLWQNRKLFNDA